MNGRLTTVSFLAEIGPLLGEIAGQRDHQRLSSSAFQRSVLDSAAGEETVALAAEVAAAVGSARAAGRLVDELRASERERSRELDVLDFEIREIESGDLREGEGEALGEQAARLENAEAIARGLDDAVAALHGDRGAEELLAVARSAIGSLAEMDAGLSPLARRLEDASYEIADIAADLVRRRIDPDPSALEEVRDRLAEIARLRRKYGDDEAEILGYLERARARARELESLGSHLHEAEEEARAGMQRATALAESLGRRRRSAARDFAEQVETLLAELAMPEVRFEVAFRPRSLYEGGLEEVELLVATDPGAQPRPVAKIASGGELSRIALALHLVSNPPSAGTVVFDEVDAGVGGEAARSVGRSLAALGSRSETQVIVVTHLPQVAAFADWHFRVSKAVVGGRAFADVVRVDGDERVAELSRMLAGLPESGWAREHAQELLDLAASRVSAA